MDHRDRGPVAMVASWIAIACFCTDARAQSAADGFDPGASDTVWALAVQPDGKIVVGGTFTMLGGGGTGATARNHLGRVNADGSLDTFDPSADGTVYALALQPDGKILVGGAFSTLGGGEEYNLGRLNADGSTDTSFAVWADAAVLALAVQPDGKILVGGDFTTLHDDNSGMNVTRNRIGRLNADGSPDDSFNPGANNFVLALAVQPDGKILVGGGFTTLGGAARNRVGRLNADGSLDASFDPGADDTVRAVALQADGKILVGGLFTTLGGATRNRIGRLNANGSLDTSFNPGADAIVYAVAVQPDGKTLVGGGFTTLGGAVRNRIGRLNVDGSIDLTFNPGANASVVALAVQPDGKIVVGGVFGMLGGGGTGTTVRNRVGRVYADGSLDADLNPGADGYVESVAVQSDGKILVGGEFTTLSAARFGTMPRNHLGRLNVDGSVSPSFDPGANADVRAVAVQPDGKILVGGEFTMLGGGGTGAVQRYYLGRLNADGSVDTTFNPGANGMVLALAVQSDKKILVGGSFTMLGGGTGTTPRSSIGRLNEDGTLDTSFNPSANGWVFALMLQPNGQILVGGDFTTLGGDARGHLGRLNANGSLDSFNPGADNTVQAVALQSDDKILVGGLFTTLGGGGTGTTSRNAIGRLNANGSLDSFNPGAAGWVYTLVVQPDDKILVGGFFGGLGGGTGTTPRSYIGRLNADGAVDPSFDPGADLSVETLAIQLDGKILVGGLFTHLGGGGTTPRNYLGRLNPDGSLDPSFNPGASSNVLTLVTEPGGTILVGGQFTTLGGGRVDALSRYYLGRLDADGSLDPSFNPGADNVVATTAVQPDGKILVGGLFTTLGGGGTGTTPRRAIGRLNANGSLDSSFDPGSNGWVYTLVVQPDGKILVGGFFNGLGGGTGTTARNFIGRLNAAGTVDTLFDPGANLTVNALALQPDGKILAGGAFTTLGGGGTTLRNYLGRLNPDGSLDMSFDPGADFNVYAVALQPDGKILVGGAFTKLGGGGTGTTSRSHIGRLNADGSLDTTFNPGANGDVRTFVVQPDGKILVGGDFTSLGGAIFPVTTRNYIGRLNADGSLDSSFDPGADSIVMALAEQADGKIVAGGFFSKLGGGIGATSRTGLGRLTNTNAALQNLAVTGSTITWSRSGAGSEVGRTTFELSTDGVAYTLLGSGTRIAGGWQLGGQTPAFGQNMFVRARGYYQTGEYDGSGSIVESIRNIYVPHPPFMDDPLTAGSSVIRAVHVTELRARIDSARARYGLGPYVYTSDPTVTAGTTLVRAQHILELRTALAQAYITAGLTPPSYGTSPGVGAAIVAADIAALRSAVVAIE